MSAFQADIRVVKINGQLYRRKVVKTAHCERIVEDFIADNAALWPQLNKVGIEKQKMQPYIKLSQEFYRQIQEACPHIRVMIVNPRETRAYFGTSMPCTNKKKKWSKEDWQKRKALSVALMPKLMSGEDMLRAKGLFKKLDDVVEASLLAYHVYHMSDTDTPALKKPKKRKAIKLTKDMIPHTGPRIKRLSFQLKDDLASHVASVAKRHKIAK